MHRTVELLVRESNAPHGSCELTANEPKFNIEWYIHSLV